MKKVIVILILFLGSAAYLFSQGLDVNGEILSDTNNVTIVKLWGTSEERGFAYGYLLGDRIVELFEGATLPYWGDDWPAVRNLVLAQVSIHVDSIFWAEARAIIEGVTAAGYNTSGYDSLDVIAGNCWHDLSDWDFTKDKSGFHCSALMNWNEATDGTDLDGCSVISRHLDGQVVQDVVDNAVIVIHIPSEENLQPWLLVGYAGDMAPYSGINSSGLSIFSTVLDDQSWNYNIWAGYEPFRFTYRRALESADYNQDGENNMQDIRDAISSNSQGYSWGWNFAALGPSTAEYDSLIALVAEVAPEVPYITFRTNSYSDIIPGDNLFAANSQIKRRDYRHYCWRYYGIVNNIGDGTGIGTQENWDLMKNYTNLGSINLQFMQYIPEWGQLNLSVYQNNTPAYLHDPIEYNVNEFFYLEIPVADFSADTTLVVEGDTIHFTDLSENNPTSWEWEFEGGTPETSNEQNPAILYDMPGDYDATLIVTNTYGSDTILKADYIHVDSLTTSIETYNSRDVIFYPNPAKDKLLISCNDNIQSVDIFNNAGQVVNKLKCNVKLLEINIVKLPPGIYFIRLQAGNEQITRRMIKL